MKSSSKEYSNMQLQENIDFYRDAATGLIVFTEKFHLQKGHCCGSGCRHCPFEFAAVPEPQRSMLILNKKSAIK